MVEEKKPAVPDWAVKLILGGSAIAVGGYIVYYFVSGGALAAAAQKEIAQWTEEYQRELKKITDEGRIPTSAEEYALKAKAERIEAAYHQFYVIYDRAIAILLGIFGIYVAGKLISRLARDYWETHARDVRTPAAAIQLLRESIAIDLHAFGHTSLAVALHTQTQTMFQTLYVPMMQSEIATLTSQLPTLVGAQLIWAQFLIQSLQIEMTSIIPGLMAAARAILYVPPPPIL